MSIALAVLPAVVAVACPQVAIVFGFLGATISVSQLYVFPAMILWVTCPSYKTESCSSICVITATVLLLLIALVLAVAGTIATAVGS